MTLKPEFPQRPQISDTQAARSQREDVLRWCGPVADPTDAPWQPDVASLEHLAQNPDYVVDASLPAHPPRRFRDIQSAIDQALRDGSRDHSGRQIVIAVSPGLYRGPVYVPASAPPLALIGGGAEHTRLCARVEAQMPGQEFQARYGALFDDAHPDTRLIFERIAAREVLTTGNSSVLRIEADDVTISSLHIENLYACDRASAAPNAAVADAAGRFQDGQHQAVALHVAGADRVFLHALTLSSFQDTLYVASPSAFTLSRCAVDACVIEGDVDFIFGNASVHFKGCTIRSRGLRGAMSWAVAPNTNLNAPFGFVFQDCDFTHDGAERGGQGGFCLGRQWFEGVRATPYGVPTLNGYRCAFGEHSTFTPPDGMISRHSLEAVGKCLLFNCKIGPHINPVAPWDDWNGAPRDIMGQAHPLTWNPRYRPVQISTASMQWYIGDWLRAECPDFVMPKSDDLWLGEYRSVCR